MALFRILPRAPALAEKGGKGAVDAGGRQPGERDSAELAGGEAETAPIDRDGDRAVVAAAHELVDKMAEEGCGCQPLRIADAAALDQLRHAAGEIASGAGGGEVAGAGAIPAAAALAPARLPMGAGGLGGDLADASHGGESSSVFGCADVVQCDRGEYGRRDRQHGRRSSSKGHRCASVRTKSDSVCSVASGPVVETLRPLIAP